MIGKGLAVVGAVWVGKKLYDYAKPRFPGVAQRLPRMQAQMRLAFTQAVQRIQELSRGLGIEALVSPGVMNGKPVLTVKLPVGTPAGEVERVAESLPQVEQGIGVQVTAG